MLSTKLVLWIVALAEYSFTKKKTVLSGLASTVRLFTVDFFNHWYCFTTKEHGDFLQLSIIVLENVTVKFTIIAHWYVLQARHSQAYCHEHFKCVQGQRSSKLCVFDLIFIKSVKSNVNQRPLCVSVSMTTYTFKRMRLSAVPQL